MIPALVWLDSIQVGCSTAKAFLRYLATHNFPKPGFFFKNTTYMRALEISEKTLQRALAHLEKHKFITIERRYDENGRQISNGIYLNIPEEFLNNYEKMIEGNNENGEGVKKLSTGEGVKLSDPVKLTTLGASNCRGGERQNDAPYNNNKNNNKFNNTESAQVRKKRAPLSASFQPSDLSLTKLKETSQKSGVSIGDLLTKFKNVQKTKDKWSADWDAELQMFLLNEKPALSIVQNRNNSQEIRCTVQEWGRGHPTWEAIYGKKKQNENSRHSRQV